MPEILYEIVCDTTSKTLWLTQEELKQLGASCPICEGTDWSGTGNKKTTE